MYSTLDGMHDKAAACDLIQMFSICMSWRTLTLALQHVARPFTSHCYQVQSHMSHQVKSRTSISMLKERYAQGHEDQPPDNEIGWHAVHAMQYRY